ncbi:MAG: DUF2240 family protein [Candidatus Lokiarchaeota archaeon]|nr:DUF2240 family protein [Candidatus Lokiarchaeota archaeon]
MVSLQPASNQPKDVLKHVYYCLGKDTIPYQDLVFFMAFDLKLFPPSGCEKMLAAAKSEGFLDISEGKMVKINAGLLLQKPLPPGTGATHQDIVNALALNEAEIDKAIHIKADSMKSCSIDGKTGVLTIAFSSNTPGKNVRILVDPVKKTIIQDTDDDPAALAGKRVLLKHAIRAVMLCKENKPVLAIFGDVISCVKDWKFMYKRA